MDANLSTGHHDDDSIDDIAVDAIESATMHTLGDLIITIISIKSEALIPRWGDDEYVDEWMVVLM